MHKNCLDSTARSKFFSRGEAKRGSEVIAHRGNPENYVNPDQSIIERYHRKARPSTANPDAGRPNRNKSVLSRTEKSFAKRIMGDRATSIVDNQKMFSESVSVSNRPAYSDAPGVYAVGKTSELHQKLAQKFNLGDNPRVSHSSEDLEQENPIKGPQRPKEHHQFSTSAQNLSNTKNQINLYQSDHSQFSTVTANTMIDFNQTIYNEFR